LLDVLCWVARGAGDLAEAEAVGRAAHRASLQTGFSELIATTAATLGWALLQAGRAPEGLEPLGTGAEAARRIAEARAGCGGSKPKAPIQGPKAPIQGPGDMLYRAGH